MDDIINNIGAGQVHTTVQLGRAPTDDSPPPLVGEFTIVLTTEFTQ